MCYGLQLGALPTGVAAANLTIQTSIDNQVNLIFADDGNTPPAVPTSFPFWDGSAMSANGRIDGGSGTWTAIATNWTTLAATANRVYNPEDLLIFSGAMAGEEEGPAPTFARLAPQIIAATPSVSSGIVAVDASAGAITLENGMQFAVTGYTLTGDDIVLAATEPCNECSPLPGHTVIRVGDGTDASTNFVATIESRLVGESGLLKTDRGALILSGANSYSGGTEIAGGMVQGDTASLQGDVEVGSDGTLLFMQGMAGTYEGGLSGSGILAKQGAGLLRLTGESSAFDGTASLTEGELAIDGKLGSALFTLEVRAGATLSGAGRIGGSVAIDDATASPGGNPIARVEQRVAFAAAAVLPTNPVGLLTVDGDFSLTSASILAFQLGDPGGQAGLASDLINVGGNLTLDGTLDVTDAGGFGIGLYRLINYGGTLTDNELVVGSTPEGFAPADLTVQTSVANQVNLLVGTPVTSFNFWDGANLASDGAVGGGTAVWRADTTNWTLADGTRNGVFDPAQLLVFAGTAGTITVDNTGGPVRAIAGLQFATNGYRIEGGAIALDGTAATMRVGDGTAAGSGFTATVASALTGSASLDKTDRGTLVLSGANTYTGGTRVFEGTLQIAADSALGAATSAVRLDSGTLRTTATLTSTRNFTIGNGGGTIDSGANVLALSGNFSGTGNLRFVGSGARTLSGNNSGLLGNSTLTAGSLALTGSLGGRLSVAAPATLTGTGRAGFLDLSGTLSPGTAAGNTATFTLTDDFVVRAGSTLQIDVAASGAADRVEVGGRALVEGGTVAVTTLDPDVNYTNGTVYRIVNASGGLTGTFAGLTESSAFLDFALGYDLTGAFLTTTVIRQFPDVAETFNQIEASTGLKDLGRGSGSNALAAYNSILLLGAEPARAAFDATSGEIYPTLLASRQRAGLALAGRIAMRGRAGGHEGLAMWGGVLGNRGHVDGDGNGARSTADSFGWESGIDYRGTDNQWALGFGGGWQEGDVALAARSSRAKTDGWHLGGYARYGSGGTGFGLIASLAHSNTDASVTRQIGFGTLSRTAVSNVGLSTTAISGEMRFGLGNGALAVGPLASVDHASTRLGRIAETGAGALSLSGAGKREGWTRMGIGGFARYGLTSGFADVALRYVHRSKGATQLDFAMEGSPTGHAVRAAGGNRGAMRVDASTEFSIGDRWAISGNLGATHADKEGQIDGSLRLSYRF
ncbi:MAG TPA: autotransporter domain-containing protein [Novosphingobium sp.]|nr:autotransporter domain-containing protein [Novosphingobium sp.]